MDGSRKRRLPCASTGLHPPGLSGLRRHLDETGGQFWQAQTHQQRAGWPGTRKGPFFLFIFWTVNVCTYCYDIIHRRKEACVINYTMLHICIDSTTLFNTICCTVRDRARLIVLVVQNIIIGTLLSKILTHNNKGYLMKNKYFLHGFMPCVVLGLGNKNKYAMQ